VILKSWFVLVALVAAAGCSAAGSSPAVSNVTPSTQGVVPSAQLASSHCASGAGAHQVVLRLTDRSRRPHVSAVVGDVVEVIAAYDKGQMLIPRLGLGESAACVVSTQRHSDGSTVGYFLVRRAGRLFFSSGYLVAGPTMDPALGGYVIATDRS
jgi:hypothetical protein